MTLQCAASSVSVPPDLLGGSPVADNCPMAKKRDVEKIYGVFGRRIAKLRRERGWTLEELGSKVSLSRGSIGNIEESRSEFK